MLVTLDINCRVWLVENLGCMRSTKQRFMYCESILDDIIVQPEEYHPVAEYTPGCLVAIDKEASKRTIDLPNDILQGLADVVLSDPLFTHRPADRLTVYMVEQLELANVH